MIKLVTTAAAFLCLAAPAFASSSPAPHAMHGHMKGNAMHGSMKGNAMKGGAMHGRMKGGTTVHASPSAK